MDEELIEVEEEQLEDDIDVEEEQLEDDIEVEEEQVQVVVNKDYEPLINKPKINNIELDGNLSLSDLGIDQDFVKDDGYVHTDNNYTSQEKDKLSTLHNYDDTDIKASLNNKVDKINGKGLSTNDYTDEEKTKLSNKADRSEIPDVSSFITKDVNNLTNYTKTTDMNSAISNAVGTETTNRQNADITLQNQIDAITSASDVVDVVSTYADLQSYDTTKLTDKDVLKVMQDEEHSNAISYYRWVITNNTGSWTYVGSEGPFYTKGETDTLVNGKYTKPVNGIPKTDLDSSVQTSLGKADSAIQEHQSLTDYVKFSDYGSTTNTGVVKSGNYGFRISNIGVGYVLRATESQIDTKTSEYLPIVPSKLDYAVKSGLTASALTYTDTEKSNARSLIGAIGNTDYATNDTGGVVKTGSFGFKINANGVGYIQKAGEDNIDAKVSDYYAIVPSNLDYAVKKSITTNTLTLSNEEKEKAKGWIGANFNNTVKGKDLDLTDTTASKIQEIKLFGKSSQNVNTGSNLVQYTDVNTDYFFVNNNVIKFGTYTYVQDNGASLYFPDGSKSAGINTRLLVKKLNLEANKTYTITVEGGHDAGYGMNIAQYPVDATEIYDREAVLGQGRNFTTTFTTEASKWYMLELRTPTAGEGGPRTEAFTMKIMVNEGAPKEWEAYTNGVKCPTMTTPSPITSKTSEILTITDGLNSQTATLNLENGGIPVSSGGNYTDEDGQQYIADSIERYADGTGKLIKRVYTQNLPNSFTKSNTSGNFLLAVSNLDYAPKLPSGQYAISYDVMCNQFTNSETWLSQNGYVVVDGTKVSFATAQEFNEYFTEHPLQYEYVLDTPIETALTEEQLEELDLATYNVNTQITSDTNLEIEYIANTKQYIDNSLRELTYNRDKYTLLADTTITEGIVQPITWVSSGDDDVYDDVVVVAENFLGNGSSAFNIGYKLSNSTDFFTTNQSNVLNATTVRNYICETERYLPFKWKCTKRGATNAVADVVHSAIQPMTEWQDKIKEIKVYTSGTGMQFVQGRIRVYGRKRFE